LPETLDTVAAVLAAQRRWQEAGSAVDEGLRRAEGETRTRLLFRKAEVQAALGQRDAARASLVEARAAAGASLALAGDEKRVRAMLGDVPP
jgi:hypothetical protein